MKLVKASPKDDEVLKEFLSRHVLEGLVNTRIVRPDSFFAQYELTTDDHHTFMLKDSDDQVQAMATVLFRSGYVNDQEQKVGYITDLRVTPQREAILNWAQEFVPAIQELRDERQCQVLFSDLELYESKAYNMLLRRRQNQERMPRYHLFRKFHLIAIYGRWPWATRPLSSIKIVQGSLGDLDEICDYLRRKSVRRPLRFNLTPSVLESRINSWPNFTAESFLLARDRHGKLIGCMAPWDNTQVQQVVVKKYHGKSFQVFSTSRSLSLIRMTRALPRPGQHFQTKHITHSACDNPDIFYALLSHAYWNGKGREILVYPNYDGDFAMRPPSSFLSVNLPYGLYSVIDSQKKLPTYLHPNPFTPPPDFPFAYF